MVEKRQHALQISFAGLSPRDYQPTRRTNSYHRQYLLPSMAEAQHAFHQQTDTDCEGSVSARRSATTAVGAPW
jgi:hypothetical protein